MQRHLVALARLRNCLNGFSLTHSCVAESNRVSQTMPTVVAAHGPPLQVLTSSGQTLAMVNSYPVGSLVQLTAVAAVLLTSGGTAYQTRSEVVKKNVASNCYKLTTQLRGWIVERARPELSRGSKTETADQGPRINAKARGYELLAVFRFVFFRVYPRLTHCPAPSFST